MLYKWTILRIAVFSIPLLYCLSIHAQNKQSIKPVRISGEKHVFEITTWGNAIPSLIMEVPIGFEMWRTDGPDFKVFYIASVSEPRDGLMGIYIGHNPAHRWPESATTVHSKAGSFPITWHVWSDEYEVDTGKVTIYRRHTVIDDFFITRQEIEAQLPEQSYDFTKPPPPPDPRVGLSIHIFVDGGNAEAAKAMAEWVVTLRKKQ
jgi:hypothetical protein